MNTLHDAWIEAVKMTVPRSVSFSPAGIVLALSETAPWIITGIPEVFNGVPLRIDPNQTEIFIISPDHLPEMTWYKIRSITDNVRVSLRATNSDEALDIFEALRNKVTATEIIAFTEAETANIGATCSRWYSLGV